MKIIRIVPALALLILLSVSWYLYHKSQKIVATVQAQNDSLHVQIMNCIDGPEEMTVYFNGGVDWVTVACVEVASNLYPKRYRDYHERIRKAQCKPK